MQFVKFQKYIMYKGKKSKMIYEKQSLNFNTIYRCNDNTNKNDLIAKMTSKASMKTNSYLDLNRGILISNYG